jgi:TatD DNase family protein
MLTDSHCHLAYPGLHENLDAVLERMHQNRVDRALNICTTLEEFDAVHAIALRYPGIWASVGVHPDEEGVHEPSEDELVDRALLPRVIGIGETGLDYFRLGDRSVADMEWQRERFRVHIRAALRADRPLIIHTRAAAEDTLAILADEGQGRARGVMHCFTESWDIAVRALDLGFYISIAGIVTFKNAQALREVATRVPLDRLLVETDSPYLAPVPHRGKTNEPAYVAYVAQFLAGLRGVPLDVLSRETSDNFSRLFDCPEEAMNSNRNAEIRSESHASH